MVTLPLQPPVNNLHLLARQVVEGFLIGLHKSPFHGFSVEFAEHRLYNAGDPLKHVDWKVYGRSDKMFTKKFEEETNLRCCLALDTSSSMHYPRTGLSKLDYATVAAASLSYLIKRQMDACSLALFDQDLYHLTPAKTGSRQQQMIVDSLEKLLDSPGMGRQTNLPKCLHELAERLHQRSLVIIFSDLPEGPDQTEALLSALQHLRFNKHEIILFHIIEGARELGFEYENRPYTFEDMETGATLRLNPEEYRSVYQYQMKNYLQFIKDQCAKYKIDLAFCDMHLAPQQVLREYLVKRNKMM
jgi:uncharacterized protein (DUF58 family)